VGFGFILADGGLLSILRQRARIRSLQRDVLQLEAQHRALAREVELRRDDPATIERLAREEYGMIYAGEKIVRIVEVSEAQAQRMEAAREKRLRSALESPVWDGLHARADSLRSDSASARRSAEKMMR
jgi:hypothetical protein